MSKAKRLRKKSAPRAMKKRLLGSFMVLFLSVGCFYLVKPHASGWVQSFEEFVAKTIDARVERILVEGVVYTDVQNMADALDLKRGSSLVQFDAAGARDRLEQLPWVRHAVVERRLPSTVAVFVYEYKPLARVQVEGDVFVVDVTGHKIKTVQEKFKNFPLIYGENADENAADFIALIKGLSSDMPKVTQGVYVGHRRWNIGFETGAHVLLPEKDPIAALTLLMTLQNKKKVLNTKGVVVDLRLEDRVVLRMPKNEKRKERVL